MVDGDATYNFADAPAAIARLRNYGLDLVNIRRTHKSSLAYRAGHFFGNRMLTGAVRLAFGRELRDMLSGYKVISRALAKSFPATSSGFEIETELAVHALELGIGIDEISSTYVERPAGSVSKLSTIRDGIRIALMIARLIRSERPFIFFFVLALTSAAVSLGLGIPIVLDFLETGLVPRFPTAILAGFMAIIAMLLLSVGLTLDLVQKARLEQKRLAYLAAR